MKTNADSIYNQRQKLTRDFLHEYLLQKGLERPQEENQKLAVEPESETKVGAAMENMPPVAAARRPDLEELSPGQIRLLTQPAERIQVLLMRPWGGDCWLVVPFSTYTCPATDEEWRLGGGRTMNLEVLQLWNARSLNARFLRQSWLVDELHQQEKTRAEIVFASSLAGNELPPEMQAETGLPIVALHDPRLDYKEEQLARFAELDAVDLLWSELAAEAAAKAVRNIAPSQILRADQDDIFPPSPSFASQSAAYGKIFSSLPLAASGRASVSQCWHYSGFANQLLQHLLQHETGKPTPVLQAEVVSWCGHQEFPTARDMQKPWLWDWRGQKNRKISCQDALFFHRRRKILLGTGYALRENLEGTIVLRDWLTEKTPLIESPADITIFLTEPENFGYG